MANNVFFPPGIGKVSNVFPGQAGGSGVVQIQFDKGTFPRASDLSDVIILVQNHAIDFGERTQEVTTLSETEHLYTFGRRLPRLTIQGLVLGSAIITKGQAFFNGYDNNKLLFDWEKQMRARKSGEQNKPKVQVYLEDFAKTFSGVATRMMVNKDLSNEAMASVTLEIIVLRGFED